MKFKCLFVLILAGLLLAGCADRTRVLNKCPDYFTSNIGEIKNQNFSPLGLFFKGYVQPDEKDCPIHLFMLADEDIVLEEAFHSFELRLAQSNYPEWEQFYLDFHAIQNTTYKNYMGILGSAIVTTIPFADKMPVKGKANFYSTISHFEDTAQCFVLGINGKKTKDPILEKKCKVVMDFANGKYQKPDSYYAQQNNPDALPKQQ